MIISVDLREKLPFTFTDFSDVTLQKARLETGDYSLPGLQNKVCVERKSINDLALCLGRDRNRFFAELARARGIPSFVVVVESPFSDLESGRYKSMLNAKSAAASVIAVMCRWGIQFHFANDRDAAERFTYNYLRLYAEGQRKELLAVQRALTSPGQALSAR